MMRIKEMAVIGVLLAIPIVSVGGAFAGPWAQTGPSSRVDQSPEEYELKLLEDQIGLLRNRLMLKGKMDDKMKAEWNERYSELRARLDRWNDSVDAVH